MKKSILIAAVALGGILTNNVFAQNKMSDTTKKAATATSTATATTDTAATKDVYATLSNIADETTLVTGIKAANLDVDLKGAGPFTVLAPSNEDFNAIPKGKLDSLMKDPTKLATTLKGHVISGKYDKAALIKALVAGKGTAILKTIDGQTLTLSVKDKKLAITDAQGTTVEVTSFDTPATNGVIDGINGVLMTK